MFESSLHIKLIITYKAYEMIVLLLEYVRKDKHDVSCSKGISRKICFLSFINDTIVVSFIYVLFDVCGAIYYTPRVNIIILMY